VRMLDKPLQGSSLYGNSILRNRRLVCVCLRGAESHALISLLVSTVDAGIENFRPGVTPRADLYRRSQAIRV